MLALPQGAAETGADRLARRPSSTTGWPGRNGARCVGDADRAHARAAAAVRDAERLVQVEVADVGADVARAGRGRPARSCSRRPCRPGRRARGRSRRSRGSPPRTRRASTGRSPSARRARRGAASALALQVGDVDVAVARRTSTDDDLACRPSPRCAGLVPCADGGIRQTSRWPCAARLVVARGSTSSPAYSPCEPAFGCSDTAAKPVISASHASSCSNISLVALASAPRGANGCSWPNSGQVTGIISRGRVQLHRAASRAGSSSA